MIKVFRRFYLFIIGGWLQRPNELSEPPREISTNEKIENAPETSAQDQSLSHEPTQDETVARKSEPISKPISPARIERRAKLRRITKQRIALADKVDSLLTAFENINFRSYDGHIRESQWIDDLWSNLMGCDFYLMDDVVDEFEEMIFLNTADDVSALADLVNDFWPLDHAVIVRKETGYFLNRLHTANASEVRGRTRIAPSKILHSVYGHLEDDGSWWIDDEYYGWINNRWRPLPMVERTATENAKGTLVRFKNLAAKKTLKEIHDTTSMFFSAKLSARYKWHVALGVNQNGPRILLPTNPVGCCELFKDRDKSLNRTRRNALRHWVVRHYRDKGEAGLAFVRQHLRGATDFSWRQLTGEILVSAYDLERNRDFKNEAEHWRSARQHNSFRVRVKRKAAQNIRKLGGVA